MPLSRFPAGFPHLSPAGENAGAISVFEGGPTRPQAASAVFLGRARGETRGEKARGEKCARSGARSAGRVRGEIKARGNWWAQPTLHAYEPENRRRASKAGVPLAEHGNESNESNPGNEDCYAASRWRVSVWSASSEVGLTSLSVALREMRRSWTKPRLPTAKNS